MNQGLKSFPQPLYSKPVKMTDISSFAWFTQQTQEILYTVKNGNWNDPLVWQTVSGRPGRVPIATDDVYIRHTIQTNLGLNAAYTVNNFFVSATGYLQFTGSGGTATLNVNGNIQSVGTIDMLGGQFGVLILSGSNNSIQKSTFLTGTSTGLVTYSGNKQAILNLNYDRLAINGSNQYFVSDLSIKENLSIGSTVEINGFNLTVNGTTVISGKLVASGAGSLLFVGAVTLSGTLFLSGNPSIELRNGLTSSGGINSITSGTGTWSFTTNNQTLSLSLPVNFLSPLLISGAITLNNVSTGSGSTEISNSLDGNNASSAFVNKGILNVNTQTVMMATAGTVNFTGFTNTVNYIYTGSGNIDKAAFTNLGISGGGTKTLTADTTASGTFILSSATLELSTFNFSVTGTTTISTFNIQRTPTSTGALLKFIGLLSTGGGTVNVGSTNNIEFQAGITFDNIATITANTVTFSTNNQTLATASGSFRTLPIIANITVNTGITVQQNNANVGINLTGYLNAQSGTSTWTINAGTFTFSTDPTPFPPMSGGSFNVASTSNIGYNFNGNFTIPSTLTGFNNFAITGTGTKTLSANMSLNGTLGAQSSTGGGGFELSTFNLSVAGATIIGANFNTYLLSKSGAGSVLFGGTFNMNAQGATADCLDFTGGNPTVELRGGLEFNAQIAGHFKTGSGVWSFTTNNQIITNANNVLTVQMDCPILISGAITVIATIGTVNYTLILTGVLNGNNAASIFDNRLGASSTSTQYQNATAPMATGLLYCNQNTTNTWIYNLNGNQDITPPGDPVSPGYRNLTLSVGGAKRLLGNVSVKGVYTLSAPATLNSNGHTLTNP